MSAIVAAAGRQLSERTRKWVIEATAYSAIAGPDDQAVAFGPNWGLGHALLRTGRDDAEQPLTRDGRVWLAAEVRLDARSELLASLPAGGAVDRTASDPELLLAAYDAWGDAFLEHLAGDFGFALWDGRRDRLVCGRDQIGVIPLHYAPVGDELLVATALNALLLHPAVGDQLDEESVADFLLRGCTDFPATAFRSIRRVPPAHSLSLLDGSRRLRRYWRLPEWQPLVRFKAVDEYPRRFRDLLETAVAERITDDRLVVHVSGGMDSTSVAALAREVMTKRGCGSSTMRGATMVLGGASGDQEGQYAELVARALGIELDVSDGSLFEPTDPLADTPTTPEPTPYRWSAMEHHSVLRAADHARLLLTGFPGDGLLMFVPWYWAEWLARGRPRRLLEALADNRRLFASRPHPHLKQSAKRALAGLSHSNPPLPGWLAPEFIVRANIIARARRVALPPASTRGVRSLIQAPEWTGLFASCDPTAMGIPLRMRHPIADLRLLDFISRLPPEPWLIRKRILRESMRGLLPDAVRERPKTLAARGPRDTITGEALQRLARLVGIAPGLEEFFDRQALIDAILIPEAAMEHPHDHLLLRALGLVDWRAHWRRPASTGLQLGGVRLVSNLAEGNSDDRSTGAGHIRLA